MGMEMLKDHIRCMVIKEFPAVKKAWLFGSYA